MKPEKHPSSVNLCLAEYLSGHKEIIMSEWLERVLSDTTIPTEAMTRGALRDHVPQLLDDVIKTLHRADNETVAPESEKDAEEHGAVRWQQGFELTEMLHELKHLRIVFIIHLRVFEKENENFDADARLFVSSAIHQFLDEMAIDATRQFLNEGCKTRKSF